MVRCRNTRGSYFSSAVRAKTSSIGTCVENSNKFTDAKARPQHHTLKCGHLKRCTFQHKMDTLHVGRAWFGARMTNVCWSWFFAFEQGGDKEGEERFREPVRRQAWTHPSRPTRPVQHEGEMHARQVFCLPRRRKSQADDVVLLLHPPDWWEIASRQMYIRETHLLRGNSSCSRLWPRDRFSKSPR